jgi:transcriptional regulator GlxA family with amidase domain
MNVGIYIYDDAEVLDFSGPFEVLSTASRVCDDGASPFAVFLIGETGEVVTARANFQVTPHYSIRSHHPKIDVLIVVGGVHEGEMLKPAVTEWIAATAKTTLQTASVCTGAFLLAAAKVITDQRVTIHWDDTADLHRQFPQLNVKEGVRWVDDGAVVTSAGISAGISMSLYLVSKLHSQVLAEKTARIMEFDWEYEPTAEVEET